MNNIATNTPGGSLSQKCIQRVLEILNNFRLMKGLSVYLCYPPKKFLNPKKKIKIFQKCVIFTL
ncbi:MAG: hypothetical protein A2Y52_05805 [Sulfuricurvum sp. RIFCSPLOWO2_02_43_6]|nr:MAG: hypothetical protein A2Y52_05805 [Sulfuricurvum sp. RIFCSPLOWO2_02_43_6]